MILKFTKLRKSFLTTASPCIRGLSARARISLDETLKDGGKPPNPQEFVNVRLTPGEVDPLTRIYKRGEPNPVYRPKWKNRAQIISAEDFARQPKVSFDEQYSSMHDAMVVLSWLNENQRQDVYQMYLQLMMNQEKEFDKTSHEYSMRVIGEKFNITPQRVAAIVQNCHDEEQIAKEGGEVHDKVAAYVDVKIKEHIDKCYNDYGELNPNQFVEPPAKASGIMGSSAGTVRVEDLYDIDDLTKKAIVRDMDDAQLLIDRKIYIEDVDDDNINSSANTYCSNLIKQKNEGYIDIKEWFETNSIHVDHTSFGGSDFQNEENSLTSNQRRPRWKYVAKTINVREQRKKGKKSRTGGKLKKKDQLDNTLVENDGVIRLATVKEMSQIAWKSKRHQAEFTYRGVKAAWLNKKFNGEQDGWGKVQTKKIAEENKVEEKPNNGSAVSTN